MVCKRAAGRIRHRRDGSFRAVLDGALNEVLAHHGLTASSVQKSAFLDLMKELPPHPDALKCFETLKKGGVRLIALSNGAAAATMVLLERANLDGFIERIVSVDEVKRFKPRHEVYSFAAAVTKVEQRELALVAAHPWDVYGAKSAGALAAFVARDKPYPTFMIPADWIWHSLTDVAHQLVTMR